MQVTGYISTALMFLQVLKARLTLRHPSCPPDEACDMYHAVIKVPNLAWSEQENRVSGILPQGMYSFVFGCEWLTRR